MYELGVHSEFAAAHALRDYQGPCERLHGHNYEVEVTVAGDLLDDRGLLLDFADLKKHLNAILDTLDHQCLNDLPAFAELSPTSEVLARLIFEGLKPAIEALGLRLVRATVWETARAWATYSESPR
jgi:6-pyruvoyltetrahydropterin/6-carboxytetrahydropterin synthase